MGDPVKTTSLDEKIVDSRAARYLLIIGSGVLICALVIGSVLSRHQQTLRESHRWVGHTYEVMNTALSLAADVQRMMSGGRGYLLSKNPEFLNNYERYQAKTSGEIDRLKELTQDNPIQSPRSDRLRQQFETLVTKLEEEKTAAFAAMEAGQPVVLSAQGNVLNIEIQQQIDDVVNEEERLLGMRLEQLRKEQVSYDQVLYGGIGCAAIIIILLNTMVMKLHARKEVLAESAAKTEERFSMAMKSTSDGIFDWDITAGTIYYSSRFKQMLGYRDDELNNSRDAIHELIHPDDIQGVEEYVARYLEGGVSDFNAIYRIRHKMGSYLWLHARARASFAADGTPVRMVGAVADITAMKAIEERLRIEREWAVKASRAKSEFLTNMSHEIRTPLNAIVGVSSILQRKMTKSKEQEEQLINTLQSSSMSLLDLINDILDLARIESGSMEIENQRFRVGGLIQQVMNVVAVRAEEKGLKLARDSESVDTLNYSGDEGRMRQVLVNIIGNAVKFTDKGSVLLRVWRTDGALHFSVSDTGVGIAKEDLKKIFAQFEQVDPLTIRKYGGSGLGLAISKQLAGLMGGTITVESTPGEGSIFTFSVPDRTSEGDHASEDEPFGEIVPLVSMATDRKILIAEDVENNLLIIKFFMESLGIPYDIAANGAEAVKMYKKHRYPLVMMDVQMPVMNGIEATQAIRTFEVEQGLVPTIIVAMTAHAMVGDAERCFEAGMNDYMSKPLLESDIRQKLHIYISALTGSSPSGQSAGI